MDWNDVTMMIVGAYLLMNLVVMIMYAFDKHRARTGGERISERALLIAALFGPFGALVGMRAFHHKTRKARFLLVPLFVVLHLVLFYLLIFF